MATTRFEPLPRRFFTPSAELVAPRLLGHWLIRNLNGQPCGGLIVEVEAYLRDDPACHASRGQTERNRVMFGLPGHAYVYLIYGVHFCVNVVCCPAGIGEAVLIRAIEPAIGPDQLRARRPGSSEKNLTNGPGKLCQAMEIDRSLDGADLCNAGSDLFIARNPGISQFRRSKGPLVTTTRIGITRAAALPLRFYLGGSSFASK